MAATREFAEEKDNGFEPEKASSGSRSASQEDSDNNGDGNGVLEAKPDSPDVEQPACCA